MSSRKPGPKTSEVASRTPLPLPANFNPLTYMLYNQTDNGLMHESRKGASFAAQLVANGAPQDLELAEKVLNVVLGCQERHAGDAHYGNFMWMIEDKVIEDLNAVEFNLEHLIPMMLQYRERLAPATQERLIDAICLGLEEIRRLDVAVVYTNITILDILNTSLGGELLGDATIAGRGYRKFVDWMAFTDSHGIPYEYNSPTYASVGIRAFKRLADLVKHEETRIRARTAAARLGLSVALHIHAGTGRWAGPHSRAYHPSVVCETDPEINLLDGWLKDGALPAWIGDALSQRPAAFEVSETAYGPGNMGITTYHSPSFDFGVSAKEFGGQSDVIMSHFVRPGVERPGVLYTRYLTNDKWLGDFYHATDRTRSRNLIEEGNFYGVQQGARVIGLYALKTAPGVIRSAKAAFIWTERSRVDEIWIGERKIDTLPAKVKPGEVVVIGSGNALFAVLPLSRTDMGRDAPIRLIDNKGDLVLEIYNYLGPQKGFWEMNWPGAFYKGRPQCGVYLEAAERTVWADGREFGRAVASGTLKDNSEPPFTYLYQKPRLWTVEYRRDGQTLGIEVDLTEWALERRWTQAGELGWPMLESPMARETRSGRVTVGGATLTCGKDAAWLFASPATGRYVAGYHGQQPAPLTLTVPGGSVRIAAMATGTVLWDNGKVTVDAIGVMGEPVVTTGR